LPIKDYKLFSPDIINSFSEYDLICIDDIDIIFGIEEWEHSFFILVNKVLESSKKIIYTSSSSLLSRNIDLKDLHSRLSWGLVFKINNADDIIKEKILQKIILEKEYNISFNVCKYLLQREERNLSSLVNIIHKAGLYSFSTQKKVSTRDINDILA
jgi:DnaA family protein